jgi:hypothetical protein
MREGAGVSLEDAAKRLGLQLDSMRQLEYSGTQKFDHIRAMAALYRRDAVEVAEAARWSV